MSVMRGVGALLLTGLAVASPISAEVASACEAPRPSAEIVAARATSIVTARVADRDLVANDYQYTLAVDEALKGDSPHTLRVERTRVSACGDGITVRVGEGIILARGVPFLHEPSLDAYWVFDAAGTLLDGSNVRGFTIGSDTIETVAQALKDSLPDTSAVAAASPEPQSSGVSAGMLALPGSFMLGGLLLGGMLKRRRGFRASRSA
jgi:hypothetical protein